MPAGTPALLKTATASLRATFVLAIIIWAAGVCAGTGLQSATAKAFDDYINKTEARMADELLHGANFLWIDGLATDERSTAYEDLRAGRVAVENARGTKTGSTLSVPGGLIHDWKGVVFVPGVSLDETLALLEDYDHDDDYFSPDVIRSKPKALPIFSWATESASKASREGPRLPRPIQPSARKTRIIGQLVAKAYANVEIPVAK